MIKNFKLIALYFILASFIGSCKKNSGITAPAGVAVYTLVGAPGTCATPVVAGTYSVGTTMTNLNTLTFTVDVAVKGTYGINTTPANGVWFSGSGTFTTTGPQTVVLVGNGVPAKAGNFAFVLITGNACNFTLSFIDGAPSAVFTYAGAPSNCTAPVINGTYASGVALGSGNYVDLAVNVTTPGAYTVSTNSANGMSFSGSGAFTTTGAQVIRLIGNGTPSATGIFTFKPSNNGCNFSVTVAGLPPVANFTYNGAPGSCTGPVISGTFAAGTALTPSSTIKLGVNVIVAGSYAVTTTSSNSNGVTFSASGVFPGTGPQTITLTSTNTPTAAGTFTYTPSGGCSFDITYTGGGGGGGDYIKCTIDGIFIDFSNSITASLMPGTFAAVGDDATGNKSFEIDVIDLMGGNITTGTYSKLSPTNANRYCDPYYTPDNGNPGNYWATDPLNANIFTVVIQTITPNRVTGTFSGDLFDSFGANKKVVTNGTFSVPY